MKKFILTLLAVAVSFVIHAQDPIMQWNFEDVSDEIDTLEGLFTKVNGVVGKGILLDGFTTRVVRKGAGVKHPSSELTVDAWIALGNYPWNWCPVLTTESDEVKGYRLMIGPLGQLSMQVAIGEEWVSCTSATEMLPLHRWHHVTGTYKADDKIEIFINGKSVNSTPVKGRVSYTKSDCILGMTAVEGKPSNIHRTWGTLPQFYGLDGILDEVKVFDRAFTENEVSAAHSQISIPKCELQPRHLPIVETTGEFKAYYTKLKYYPGWDNLWRVGDDPDIVVCFEKNPVKLVFWRGIRYGASWVSENQNWMSDQSVEAWGVGNNDKEGCFEHMQDRHCRFSHVRIIENTPARIVVHWRYAPVSSHNNTWRVDEKTGWECWVDEYYYVYPDGSAIRKVSWTTGSLGPVRQFQETLALLSPGQLFSDLVEKEITTVSNYEGKRGSQRVVEQSQPEDPYNNYTIQRYNYKSKFKPYICFEPGNVMELRNTGIKGYNIHRGCNHFPVGQARCDGRTSIMSDRPSHATSFPISWPVVHVGETRSFWCALYGMSNMTMDELQSFGRSWAYAPELTIAGKKVISEGYDCSERCYKLKNVNGKPDIIKFSLDGSKASPVINPAFYVKNWNGGEAEILVNGKKVRNSYSGVYSKLTGKDLIVFIFMNKSDKVTFTIQPE